MKLRKAFTLLEPGPVVPVTTHDGRKANVMTISWTMVLEFTPRLAMNSETYDRPRSVSSCRAAGKQGGSGSSSFR